MNITTNGLSKQERLHGEKIVTRLFKEGEAFLSYPFKCVYRFSVQELQEDEKKPMLSVVISVGKRYHKRAVKRNLIKRRSREAYRLNKSIFYNANVIHTLHMAFAYVGKKEEDYNVIENGIKKALKRIITIAQKNSYIHPTDAIEILSNGDITSPTSCL